MPSTESLRFHDICHYVGSDYGYATAKPDTMCSRSVLLTHKGKKNKTNKPHTNLSQIFLLPWHPSFKRVRNPLLSQLSNPKWNVPDNYCFQTRLHDVVVFLSLWSTWKFSAHSNILFRAWGITLWAFFYSWSNKT